MTFFDSNDLLSQAKLSRQQSELLDAKEFYKDKIAEVKEERDALMNDDKLLEKIAREKYFLKKENEDIFIIVEKD